MSSVLENKYNIKLVETDCPINTNHIVLDFQLSNQGVDEETVYLKNPFYIRNIRRGNTLVEVHRFDRTNNE